MRKGISVLLALLLGMALFCGCTEEGDKPAKPSGYDPSEVDSSIVASANEKGVKYVEDALGEESYLYRLKGSELGIMPDTGENVSSKIQSALDQLSADYKGGLLYLEKGVYKLGSQINLPKNTGIVGDWIAPEGENADKMTQGTVFDVMFGAGNDSSDKDDAAIVTEGNNMIKGLTIGYSNQNVSNPRPYPFTIANSAITGFYVENVTLVNSYRGILLDDQNVYTLKNIYMTALFEGVRIHYNYDIPELYNVNVSYKYWANAGALFGAPSENLVRERTRQATAFLFGRIDWLYLDTTFAEGYEKAYYYYRNTSLNADTREANGQYMYMNCADCKYGLYVDTTSAIGNIYTRCDFAVTGEGSAAVFFSDNVTKDFSGSADYNTGYLFNSCDFSSDEGYGLYSNGNVAVNMTYCDFSMWGADAACVTAGSYAFDSCTFADYFSDINVVSANVQSIKIINCTFEGSKEIKNGLSGVSDYDLRYVEKTQNYACSVGKYDKERYTPSEIREPENKNIYYASDYGAVADGGLTGTGTDNTQAIQHALNAAGAHGGGYVILEAGFYYVKNRLLVPEGVHFVGNAVANRHFKDKQEAATLITEYGKNLEKTDYGFITMEDDSALRNISVYYIDQDCAAVVKYSPTVCVTGDNVQINKTIFIAGYINFYVTGENALISYARGLGLGAGFIAEGIESGRFEYMFFSINDWMRTWDNEVPNAPPSGWHNHYPNFENDTFVFENCKNVTLYHSFSYAQGTGLRLEGTVENFHGIGVGIDMGRNSLIMNNGGKGNVFVNTEFSSRENNILANESYSGETTFYVSSCWFSFDNSLTSTFNGSGTVNIQQFHVQKGSFTANAGTVNMQGLIMDGPSGYAVVIGGAQGGVINSIGSINAFLVDGTPSAKFIVENCTKRLF